MIYCRQKTIWEGEVLLIITRETDYALRVLRAISDKELHNVKEITDSQMLPQAFTYKIIKKLSNAGILEIIRGAAGGCRLTADLSQLSLYDLMQAVEESSDLSACMDERYDCPWRKAHGGCAMHCHLFQIQEKLNQELRSCNLRQLLNAP